MIVTICTSSGIEKYNAWGSDEFTLENFRHVNASGGISNFLIAGAVGGSAAISATIAIVSGTVYAIPFIHPGGVIDQIVCKIGTTNLITNVYMGIYENTSDTSLAPGRCIVSSKEISSTISGGNTAIVTHSGILETLIPGELYWAAVAGNARGSSPIIMTVPLANSFPIYGIGSGFSTALGLGVSGLMTVYNTISGSLPAQFPAAPTTRTLTIPAVGLRYLS